MAAFEPSAPEAVFDTLAAKKLLIVSGKGGVGRTTVAALVGMEIAGRGARVLVATTGHDDRLAWMCGAPTLEDTPTDVGGGLSVQRVVPARCIREYGALMLRSDRVAETVFANRLVERIARTIPGLDDYAILGKLWHEATRNDRFDCVIFDGPASGHLRLNLGVPKAIVEAAPPGILRREAARVDASLRDPETSAALLVGLPERWPLTELRELAEALQRELGVQLAALVVNKLWPPVPALPEAPPESAPARRAAHARIERLRRRGEAHAQAVAEFLAEVAASHSGAPRPMLNLPFWAAGLHAPDDFARLRASLREAAAQTRAGAPT